MFAKSVSMGPLCTLCLCGELLKVYLPHRHKVQEHAQRIYSDCNLLTAIIVVGSFRLLYLPPVSHSRNKLAFRKVRIESTSFVKQTVSLRWWTAFNRAQTNSLRYSI